MNAAVADTSITSRIFKKRPEIALYQSHLDNALISISFQTIAEMRYGAVKDDWGNRRCQELEQFLASFSVVEYTSALADSGRLLWTKHVGRGDAWKRAMRGLLPLLCCWLFLCWLTTLTSTLKRVLL